MLRAIDRINVASKRMSLVCPICALSKSTSPAAVTQAGNEYPDSHIIQNVVGTVSAPIVAGMALYATYGTLLVMYESPMLSNKNSPLYPTSQPANAKRSLPKGGCTSKK